MAESPVPMGRAWRFHDAVAAVVFGCAIGLVGGLIAPIVGDSGLGLTIGVAAGALAVWILLQRERDRIGGRVGWATITVWVLGLLAWALLIAAAFALASFT